MIFLLMDAGFVLLLALSSAIYFAVRKARLQNLPGVEQSSRTRFLSTCCFLAAGGFSGLILFYYNLYLLIAPRWYFTDWHSSMRAVSPWEVRYLGITEVICWLFAMATPGYSAHFPGQINAIYILYGAVMYFRYEARGSMHSSSKRNSRTDPTGYIMSILRWTTGWIQPPLKRCWNSPPEETRPAISVRLKSGLCGGEEGIRWKSPKPLDRVTPAGRLCLWGASSMHRPKLIGRNWSRLTFFVFQSSF